MIEVLDMPENEVEEVLLRVGYGHFACARDNKPYVVPINYAYDKQNIYIYTTEGMKSEIINANPHVCLQVEELLEDGSWKSVVVMGEAKKIVATQEREKAVDLIRSSNPTLLPALAIKWANNWIRKNVEVVYRIVPARITGRHSLKVDITAAIAK